MMHGKEQALSPDPYPFYLQGPLRTPPPHLSQPRRRCFLTGLKGIFAVEGSVELQRSKDPEGPLQHPRWNGDEGRTGVGVETCGITQGLCVWLSLCLCWRYSLRSEWHKFYGGLEVGHRQENGGTSAP